MAVGTEVRPSFWARERPWAQMAVDCALAVFLILAAGAAPVRALASEGHPPALLALVVLFSGVCLALRRFWPRAVLAGVLAGTVIDFSIVPLATRNTVFDVGFVIYIVAKQLPRREAWLALAGSLAVWTVSVAVFLPGALPDMPFKPTAWQTVVNYGLVGDLVIGAAWTIGYAVRQRQAYTEALRREAERQAEARADERVVAERLRIARELHDVVAHSMSLIAVQAGVAHYVGAERPEAATQALGSIERTSREALREMRRLLGVLRGSSGEREDPELAPAPRLADLARLAEATTAAGLEVRLRCDAPRELPAGLELAAYRIVQEALTNVIKHAEARQVDVGVRYEGGVLRVEVQDDGRGGPPLTSRGHGLLGMNERVAFYGGEFAAGPAPGGGFRVAAALPLSEEATAA